MRLVVCAGGAQRIPLEYILTNPTTAHRTGPVSAIVDAAHGILDRVEIAGDAVERVAEVGCVRRGWCWNVAHAFETLTDVGRRGLEPRTLGLKVPCSTG